MRRRRQTVRSDESGKSPALPFCATWAPCSGGLVRPWSLPVPPPFGCCRGGGQGRGGASRGGGRGGGTPSPKGGQARQEVNSDVAEALTILRRHPAPAGGAMRPSVFHARPQCTPYHAAVL